jgi:hypothetical protein
MRCKQIHYKHCLETHGGYSLYISTCLTTAIVSNPTLVFPAFRILINVNTHHRTHSQAPNTRANLKLYRQDASTPRSCEATSRQCRRTHRKGQESAVILPNIPLIQLNLTIKRFRVLTLARARARSRARPSRARVQHPVRRLPASASVYRSPARRGLHASDRPARDVPAAARRRPHADHADPEVEEGCGVLLAELQRGEDGGTVEERAPALEDLGGEEPWGCGKVEGVVD